MIDRILETLINQLSNFLACSVCCCIQRFVRLVNKQTLTRLLVSTTLLSLVGLTQASQSSQILEQCRALSLVDDEIHNCLDNYLDDLDANIENLEDFIRAQLSGDGDAGVLQAFEASQIAFRSFRAANCLWYVEFSSAQAEADQIGKNCLATLSENRLSEMRQLLETEAAPEVVSGYYVYGANRNSFQPCAGSSKYWVEGENVVVSELQQRYLNEATADLQILYAELAGAVDTEVTETYAEHDGVFVADSLVTLRLPTDSDCPIAPSSADAPETRTSREQR